jgi:hypothetical protein
MSSSRVPQRVHTRDPWRAASLAGLVAILACVAAFATDAGVVWDEWLQRKYGALVLNWFRSGFRDRSALEFRDLYLYGGLFDAPAQLLSWYSPLGPYETRHVFSALIATAGVVASYKIAARICGPRAGFLAGLMLVLTPAWLGHGLFNPKDIPFGTAAAFACYVCVRIALGPTLLTWRDAVLAGLSVGAALGVRSGGMFLLGYVACVAIARFALASFSHERSRRSLTLAEWIGWARAPLQLGLRLGAFGALAWSVMIACWPWAQLAPLSRPLSAARRAARFVWEGNVLFDGQVLLPKDLPASYLPTWFAITLPETFLVALAAGVFVLARSHALRHVFSQRGLALTFVAASALSPVLGAMITRPLVYDAQRHFLFVLPPLAALSGIALSEAYARATGLRARLALVSAGLCAAALVGYDIFSLHPYEYTYFNRISGSIRHAAGRFETDYWGASQKEGLAWLVAHVPPARERRLRIGNCTTPTQTEYYLKRWPEAGKHFAFSWDGAKADFLLATTRFDCQLTPGEVLHVVEREGAPLLYVIQLPPPEQRGPVRYGERYLPRPRYSRGSRAQPTASR